LVVLPFEELAQAPSSYKTLQLSLGGFTSIYPLHGLPLNKTGGDEFAMNFGSDFDQI